MFIVTIGDMASTSGSAAAERIRASAVELFFRQGYARTSIREITSSLHMTPGALYNHFRSKEELLYSIVSRTHAGVERVLEESLLRAGDDPRHQLRAIAGTLTSFYATYRREASISEAEWRNLPDLLAAEMLASRRRLRRSVERILERGVRTGVFRLDLPDRRSADIPVATKAILNLIVHTGRWYHPDGRKPLADIADQHAFLVLQLAGAQMADPVFISGQYAPV